MSIAESFTWSQHDLTLRGDAIRRHRRARRPARIVLGWRPARDNLDEIVRQALDWERRLHNRRPGRRP